MSLIRRLLNWNPAEEASGSPDSVRRGCAQASILLGVTVGVQGMLAAMFAFGRESLSGRDANLTDLGRSLFQPERDMALYVFGSVVSLGLSWSLLRFWGWHGDRGDRPEGSETEQTLAGWAVLQLMLAAGASLVFVLAVDTGRSLATGAGLSRALGFLMLTAPGAVAFLSAMAVFAFCRGRSPVPSWLIEVWLDLVRLDDEEPAPGQRPYHSLPSGPPRGGWSA